MIVKQFRWLLVLGVLLPLIAGCTTGSTDSETSGNPSDNDAVTGEPDAPSQETGPAGTLIGRAIFEGKVPEPRSVVITKDVEHCGKFPAEQQDVTVSSSGGLTQVVVEVLNVDEPEDGWQWEQPEDGYAIRQKGCKFDPPLLVLPDGAELKVFNDDPVSHNINTGQWNVMQAGNDDEPIVEKVKSKMPVRVACNIHSWMESWIYTAQSPLYAVTDSEGNFKIEGIPPGKYRVRAWHPNLRRQQESLEFTTENGARYDFVFKSPY